MNTIEDRFWSKVNKDGLNGCWLWEGAIGTDGYGQINVDNKTTLVHRLSYEWAKGAIPEELQLDHLCRVRSCVNSDHLEAVTQLENMARGKSPSAIHARKTHCPRDHPYDEQNTYFTQRGSRVCQECNRIRSRR